jgi:hypothetical protein
MDIEHASSHALTRYRVRAGPLWFGVLCGPLAALANEQIEYFMVAWSCGRLDPLTRVLLHIVPALLIALCIVAAIVSWSARTGPMGVWNGNTRSAHVHSVHAHHAGASDAHASSLHAANGRAHGTDRGRRGFMAMLGVGLSALGIIAIVAQWLPLFYLDPCVYL